MSHLECCQRCGRPVPGRRRGTGFCTARCATAQARDDEDSALDEARDLDDTVGMSDGDCAWCGAEIGPEAPVFRRRAEPRERYCSRAHRDAAQRAVKRLLESTSPTTPARSRKGITP